MTPSEIDALFAAVVHRHLCEDDWRLVAVQPLTTLPTQLQADLRRTFAVAGTAFVVVFELEGKTTP